MTEPLLDAYGLADVPGDPELDAVARLAAALCGVPTATVNLLDAEHQHQVATHGFCGGSSPRSESMCDVTARQAEPVFVRDASADPRFAANVWVTGQRADVRFYASHQLRDAEGGVVGTLCVFDVVPRELTEQQREGLADLAAQTARLLRQRHEAQALQEQLRALGRTNAELSAFAGRVAHDLKNPLTGVLGFLALAQRRGGDLAPVVLTCLQQAEGAAVRLSAMLDGLLRFAVAGTPADAVDVDLDRLALQVQADVLHHVEKARAAVEVAPLGSLRTDPLLLGQVLQNLLGNAVKYRDPDRPPHVRLERLPSPTGGAVLVVTDNGRGIPDNAKERVFELFSRAPNAGEVTGTGIGLATVQRSVEALGGTITLTDTPGGGLTVTLDLPDADLPTTAQES
ncbi:MAG: sensor signal transduction histidine kinase [Frankiales bacterium]|nr:sensor signal transduction histidine kinase [Frankiales bacterium]